MCTDERCRHPYTCDCGENGCAGPVLPDIREGLEAEAERRTHERTLQTLKLALLYGVVYAVGVGLVVLLLGCGATLPTANEDGRDHRMLEYLQCFADHHGLEGQITLLVFHTERTYCGSDGKCGFVSCAAWPGSREVECWRRFLDEATDPQMREAASHEVCHLTGIRNELEAARCAWAAAYGEEVVCP